MLTILTLLTFANVILSGICTGLAVFYALQKPANPTAAGLNAGIAVITGLMAICMNNI